MAKRSHLPYSSPGYYRSFISRLVMFSFVSVAKITVVETYYHDEIRNPPISKKPTGCRLHDRKHQYSDVIVSAVASEITGVSIVCSTVFFRRRSKKTSELRVTGHWKGSPPAIDGFPSQRVSNAEMFSFDDVCLLVVSWCACPLRHDISNHRDVVGWSAGFRCPTMSCLWEKKQPQSHPRNDNLGVDVSLTSSMRRFTYKNDTWMRFKTIWADTFALRGVKR